MEPPTKRLKSTNARRPQQTDGVVSSDQLAPNPPRAASGPAMTPTSQHGGPRIAYERWQVLAEQIFQQRQRENANANANAVERTPPDSEDTSTSDHEYHSIEMPIGPEVQFGEHAKAPRWLVEPVSPLSQKNDLRLQPPQSNEKMATLGWKFDPGPSSQWKDLIAEQLAEYAYKYLENALEDPIFRDHLRLAITTGAYAELVANVEDPLPALPPAPATNHFGPPLGSPAIFHDRTYFYFNHERPSVAMRPGVFKPQLPPPDSPIIGGRSTTDEERGSGGIVQKTPCGKDDSFQTPREPPLFRDYGKLPTVDPKVYMAGDNTRGNAYVQALPVLQDQPHGLPNVGLENCLAGGNSAQAPPLFHDQPHGLPTVDPDAFRQHARTKKAQPKSSNPNLTAPISSMFTASNNHSNGEDEQSRTWSMRIEEDVISRLENPETRAKNFPRHVFRRIRPWAGCKISKEYINQDDLDQLPQWPTARRAFNPRVQVTVPVMNAPATVSNSPPRPPPPPPQHQRRNPRRGCQNSQQAPGN